MSVALLLSVLCATATEPAPPASDDVSEESAESPKGKKERRGRRERRTPPVVLGLGTGMDGLQFRGGLSPIPTVHVATRFPLSPEWHYGKFAAARVHLVADLTWARAGIDETQFDAVYSEHVKSADDDQYVTFEGGAQTSWIVVAGLAVRHYLGSRFFVTGEGGFTWESLFIGNNDASAELKWQSYNLAQRPGQKFFASPYGGAAFGALVHRQTDNGKYDGIALSGGFRLRRYASALDGEPVWRTSSLFSAPEDVSYPVDGALIPTFYVMANLQFGPKKQSK